MIQAKINATAQEDGTFECEVSGKPTDIATILLLICAEREEFVDIIHACSSYLKDNKEELFNQYKKLRNEESTQSPS